jgi:transposase
VIVDALGNPLALSLTGGQVHDITQADALLALVEPVAMLADKGYDADHFIESLTARAIEVVIPPKSNRKIKRESHLQNSGVQRAVGVAGPGREALLLYFVV